MLERLQSWRRSVGQQKEQSQSLCTMRRASLTPNLNLLKSQTFLDNQVTPDKTHAVSSIEVS